MEVSNSSCGEMKWITKKAVKSVVAIGITNECCGVHTALLMARKLARNWLHYSSHQWLVSQDTATPRNRGVSSQKVFDFFKNLLLVCWCGRTLASDTIPCRHSSVVSSNYYFRECVSLSLVLVLLTRNKVS